MSGHSILEIVLYFGLLTALAIPLGRYMARVYSGEARFAQRVLGPLERFIYRVARINPAAEMTWKRYALAVLVFNVAGLVLLYLLQRLQAALPLNPNDLPTPDALVSFNTATSFATNTNWQTYGGETTMSHLTAMLGLTTQNFVSAATGMAVLVALIRGFTRRTANELGNFWVDLTRSTVYVLLPLSLILALALVSQGTPQTLDGSATAQLVEATVDGDGAAVTEQTFAIGPVASQVAIKQLGTNGGGYYNVNSAHPFENPTPFSNLLEMLAILLIPGALCFSFGAMVKDRRQGMALYGVMAIILIPLTIFTTAMEEGGNPILTELGADQATSADQAGGNMEGKEVRFGIADSAIWSNATTAASNGSVNSMHDSYTPLAGMVPMWLMQLGEVVFGGVGSGLYGLLMYGILAVFIAGLMVGRTPEYLGKKIEAREVKMATLAILFPAACVLVFTAIASVHPPAVATAPNPGPHGFSEMLYAFSSGANNNGSAFAGLTASGSFWAPMVAIAMFIGRFWVIIPVLAIAGSLAAKKSVPASAGTLPTHTLLFVLLLVGTVILIGALTFAPALVLGPGIEHLIMVSF